MLSVSTGTYNRSMRLVSAVVICTAIALARVSGLSAAATGQVPDEDVAAALETARERAKAGEAAAQFALGALLYYGTTETAQGIEWIRKAAAQGHADAQFHVGQLYEFGFGVQRDNREALAWYRKAAEQGSAAAQRSVGDFLSKGRGVEPDPREAARWYHLAAERDDLRAQYELGQLYFDGTGVTRDYASAYVWFSLAASQTPLEDNRKGLIELRDIAAARMTPAAVADAQRRVAAWKPTRPGR
jgi:TPR repeat protein